MIINTLNELKQTLIDKNVIINNLTRTSGQTKLNELKVQQQNLKQQSIKIHNEIKNLKKLELNNCYSNKSDNYYNDLGITPMMVATFNSQLYNMAILKFFNSQMGATCTSYQFDVFDIAEITKISNTMEVLRDLEKSWWKIFYLNLGPDRAKNSG